MLRNFPTVFLSLFLISSLDISAQSYTTTLGLRLGDGIGMTARQRILKRVSAEGIFYQHHKTDHTVAGVMLSQHMPVLTRRLNMYAGGGIGKVFYQKEEEPSTSYNALMVHAGLEFTIARLNLSWDFVPVIPVLGDEDLTTMTAFSLRYVLIKKSKQGLFEKNNKNKKGRKKKHKQRDNKRERI